VIGPPGVIWSSRSEATSIVADQDGRAVAEQDRVTGIADPESKRSGRNHIAALQAGGVQALAEQQDAGREAQGGSRRYAGGQGVHGRQHSASGPPDRDGRRVLLDRRPPRDYKPATFQSSRPPVRNILIVVIARTAEGG
jgi:hypothetical protein